MADLNHIILKLMNNTKNVQKPSAVYFVGIGGIGMSALARYFNSKEIKVSGYDKTETILTKKLVEEGISIHYDDDIALINKEAELIIYTPAIPKNHTELNYFLQNNYTVVKRSDVLGAITKNSFNICVAGTHGKTTTSTMVAHILTHSGFGCNAFLGGISVNYNSNFWSSKNNVCVVEADEYDRSFLKLNPDVAIISAVDADHLDIYGTTHEIENAFIEFSKRLKTNGCLLVKENLKRNNEFIAKDICTYNATGLTANIHIENLKMNDGAYQFDVVNNYWNIKDVVLNMGGLHNVENALAAIGVAKYLKIDDVKIKAALASFKGIKRRFEYIIKNEKLIYIDDYAHHPEELTALISSAKNLYPNKKCTVIFQPHLYSRTKDFAEGFAKSLDKADEVILLPIYPARELPMEGVNSQLILSLMKNNNVTIQTNDEVIEKIKSKKNELLITAGAGDIDRLVEPLKNLFS